MALALTAGATLAGCAATHTPETLVVPPVQQTPAIAAPAATVPAQTTPGPTAQTTMVPTARPTAQATARPTPKRAPTSTPVPQPVFVPCPPSDALCALMVARLRPCALSAVDCAILFAANPVNYSPVLAAEAMHYAMTVTACIAPTGIRCGWVSDPTPMTEAKAITYVFGAVAGAPSFSALLTAKTFGDAIYLRGDTWWLFIVTKP